MCCGLGKIMLPKPVERTDIASLFQTLSVPVALKNKGSNYRRKDLDTYRLRNVPLGTVYSVVLSNIITDWRFQAAIPYCFSLQDPGLHWPLCSKSVHTKIVYYHNLNNATLMSQGTINVIGNLFFKDEGMPAKVAD